MLDWVVHEKPLAIIVPRFTLECTCKAHKPFCLNGVTATYRAQKGIVECVRFVATSQERPSREVELFYWTTAMLRNNGASMVAVVLREVPQAREAIGNALRQTWGTLAHLKLYRSALKYGCVTLDDPKVGWLLNTRLTQPWPTKQRADAETFEEASALAELGRISLYFQGKAAINVLPKYAQWNIVKQVLWLTTAGDFRPALPREIVSLILSKVGADFAFK